VVIAIIALLMAILMPALQRVKKQAKAVACQSNLHQWAVVFEMYAGENDGYFWSGDFNRGGWEQYVWVGPLRPYYNNEKDLRFCPTATKLREEGARDPFAAWGPMQQTGPWWTLYMGGRRPKITGGMLMLKVQVIYRCFWIARLLRASRMISTHLRNMMVIYQRIW